MALVSILLFSWLLWQHLNGGVPGHYFLADKNMPWVSNLWGALTLPLFTWYMLWRIDRRLFRTEITVPFPKDVLAAFLGAIVFGVLLGISIHEGFKVISSNTPWFIAAAALLLPVYRAEYFLGFVLGLAYWVGGVLPIVVGSVFLLMAFVVYTFLRNPMVSLISRAGKGKDVH